MSQFVVLQIFSGCWLHAHLILPVKIPCWWGFFWSCGIVWRRSISKWELVSQLVNQKVAGFIWLWFSWFSSTSSSPNALWVSRSTKRSGRVEVDSRYCRKTSLWGWLSSSEPLDFRSLLGSCTALDGQLEQFLNLILAKDWSGSQANDWHLMPASNFCDVLMFHRNRPFDNQLGSCEIMSSLAATPCLCLRVLWVTVLRKGTDVDS